ncbi:conserved hypothetical protein [Talaromyces stipitatus ATCC 10500]|uniref:Major facilitator superfamily (MFS) profile domain-containing protein n=1 Tax=Talaromyces stipitatus (strain ATCC 10500 / CBS 375.48 / QM 6759 / NRRL 1006) TaxID=441959 RepID=B8M9K2_TALSN|nr:uncharacterized protein TSTA_117770 [Talaromyces stipitatus ATCC 10500]EED18004.1 conserved hypothetical protein [Talaromyces stipitatus ATCC 10500]
MSKDLEAGEPAPKQELRQSLISRLRLRQPGQTATFTHPDGDRKSDNSCIVDFDGPDDPYRPMNWSFKKKALTTVLYGMTTMGATWASSVYSPAIPGIQKEFDIGEVTATLGTSLLLFGFGLGPILFAPLSEFYGRKRVVLTPYFISIMFSFGTAVAKDTQTIMITRFFSGFFGGAPITNSGGVLADIWSPKQRGGAMVAYAMALLGGPMLGPIVGGAIVDSYLGWRWTEYITGILQITTFTLAVIFIDETYAPTLLVYKAHRLRIATGNWALHARHEEIDVQFSDIANKYLLRPFRLLVTPICFFVALYASFVYGILYLSLASYPVEFQEGRGWNSLVGNLPFLGMLVGIVLGALTNILNQKFYIKKYIENGNRAVPEARLPPMMLGSVSFAAGLFILGWTSPKHVFWLCPIIGAVLQGLGFFTIFQAALNYLVDTFTRFSASAIAVNTFMRSVLAGTFPLFAAIMYRKLGVPWASSLLGFIAIALIPIPFVLYAYGARIRARGKWSRPSIEGHGH